MTESPGLPDIRLVGVAWTGAQPIQHWIGVPSNTLDAPKCRLKASHPQVVVFAEVKPRLTEADLLARYRRTIALTQPVSRSQSEPTLISAAPRQQRRSPLLERRFWWLRLVMALTVLSVGTPVS